MNYSDPDEDNFLNLPRPEALPRQYVPPRVIQANPTLDTPARPIAPSLALPPPLPWEILSLAAAPPPAPPPPPSHGIKVGVVSSFPASQHLGGRPVEVFPGCNIVNASSLATADQPRGMVVRGLALDARPEFGQQPRYARPLESRPELTEQVAPVSRGLPVESNGNQLLQLGRADSYPEREADISPVPGLVPLVRAASSQILTRGTQEAHPDHLLTQEASPLLATLPFLPFDLPPGL